MSRNRANPIPVRVGIEYRKRGAPQTPTHGQSANENGERNIPGPPFCILVAILAGTVLLNARKNPVATTGSEMCATAGAGCLPQSRVGVLVYL